jgi:hypothetical protein
LARTLTRGFQDHFNLSTCYVYIVCKNKTMVEARFRNGKVDLVD